MRTGEGLVCLIFYINDSQYFNMQNNAFSQLASSETAEIFQGDPSRYQPQTLFAPEINFLPCHLQLKIYPDDSEALRHLTAWLQTYPAGRAARSRACHGCGIPHPTPEWISPVLLFCIKHMKLIEEWQRWQRCGSEQPFGLYQDGWPRGRHRIPGFGEGWMLQVLEIVLY